MVMFLRARLRNTNHQQLPDCMQVEVFNAQFSLSNIFLAISTKEFEKHYKIHSLGNQ